MIITIDGPAGSGKSTAARTLAQELRIAYLDTGATYRAVAYKAMQVGADLADADAIASLAGGIDIQMQPDPAGVRVFVDGTDVSLQIRSAAVTENVRYVAGPPQVRAVLVDLQRRIGRELGSFVTEGRDQGSVVFPDADFKFYLDASPQVRAQRRYEEMIARGESADCQQVLDAIVARDARDRGRATGALIRPKDAIEIDTSNTTIGQVTKLLLACVRKGSGNP